MTWKQIETMREARLWISQVIIPVTTVAVAALAIPEVRESFGAKLSKFKRKKIGSR